MDVVYSRTFFAVATARTRSEREFELEAVRRMNEADRGISVSAPVSRSPRSGAGG